MAVLNVQNAAVSGVALTFVAATAGGDSFPNGGGAQVLLLVKNAGAAICNVTIASPTQCSQGFTHTIAVAVAVGATELIGPFPASRFNDANGNINVTYDQVATVTVAVTKN